MCGPKRPKIVQQVVAAATPAPAEAPRVPRRSRRRSIAAMAAGDMMGQAGSMGQSGPTAVPTFGS